MSNQSSSQLTAHLLLVAVTLLAAMGWFFSKSALLAITPMYFLAIRFFSSALLMAAMKPRIVLKATSVQIRNALLTGLVLGVQTSVWAAALMHSDGLGVGAFLISLSFLLIPVTGLAFGYRAQSQTWIAIAIALPGVALLALRNGFNLAPADSLFLISALLYALYFNINGRLCARIPPVTQTFYQMLSASVACTVAYAAWELDAEQELAEVWHWVLLSVVLATWLRFFLLLKAQSMAPEGQGAIVMTLEPVWVALLGITLMNETLGLAAVTGMAVIFLALMVNSLGTVRAARQARKVRKAGAVGNK